MSKGLFVFRTVLFLFIVLCWASLPAQAAIVSGTVTDGSGHGWPLYARIDISGYAGGPVFTDPVTGAYSVDLVGDGPFTFDVTAVLGGYAPATAAVAPPATQDFALTIAAGVCPSGYAETTIFYEDFENGYLNWTMGGLWNPESESNACGSPVAPFPSPTNAIYYGQDGICNYNVGLNYGDLTLISAVSIPATGVTTLTYSSYEDSCRGDAETCSDFLDTYVSTNGGSQWVYLLGNSEEGHWYQKTFDLTDYAGQNALLRFSFFSNSGGTYFGWMIDDIKITTTAVCQPVPGGMLVGNVYDANAGNGVNSAVVSSNNAPGDSVRTFATPDDAAVDDGFYMLFSSLTGVYPFTASRIPCLTDTQNATVVADGVVARNFSLQCGRIEAAPLTLEARIQIGHSTTLPLTLENTGSLPADFLLTEAEGASTIVPLDSRQGPPARHVPWQSSLQRLLKGAFTAGPSGVQQPATTMLAPPWRPIADYPIGAFGNSGAALNGAVYSVGGITTSGAAGNYVYDPVADSWTQIASLLTPRYFASAAAANGMLYVFGGVGDLGGVSLTEIYDPDADNWSAGVPSPIPAAAGTAVNLFDDIYLIGGINFDTYGYLMDVQVYHPESGSWSMATPYPEAVAIPSCGTFNGKIYCAGGLGMDSEVLHTYVYDPDTEGWTALADMPHFVGFPAYTMSDARLYISGGITGTAISNEGFAYDAMLDIWEPFANSNYTFYGGASACGFYKIAGMGDLGAPSSLAEVHPGLNDCKQVNVPWLSESLLSATIPPFSSVVVNVTLDTTGITGPGDYLAHLNISETTAYDVPDVQVILHVPPCPVITLDPPTLPGAITGTPYSQTITASGGVAPYTFAISAGALPDGLILDPAGTLSGIPTAAGVFEFDLTAMDAEDCEETLSYTIQVTCPTVSLAPTSLPSGNIGVAYDQALTGGGGTAPYTFVITMGGLPDGLTLDPSGAITGIPTTAGTFPFLVVATDAYGCTGIEIYAIYIAPCTVTITLTPATLPDGYQETAYNQTITASGGTAPYTFTVTAGALPDGLTMDAAGIITGTPTTAGSFDLEVTATDATGCTGLANYTMEIGPPCLFCDDFEDGVPAAEWNYVKPRWDEEGGQLVGTSTGGKAVATANFGGCQICYQEAEVITAGGPYNKVWMLGWYNDKKNTMELLLKEESNKILLKQRVGNRIVKKTKATFNIEPNVPTLLRMAFDGTQFTVWANGTQLMTLTPVGAVPNGWLGFQAKNTTLFVNSVAVGQ